MTHFPITDPILFAIGAIADEAKIEAYVVGGYVRDELLNRGERKDIDITVVGDGVGFASLVAGQFDGARVAIYQKFRTAAVQVADHTIEFVGARKESYRATSRNPITEEGTLEDDLMRRDFTVNALAASLNQTTFGHLIDNFNGVEDLKAKILRTPLDP